MRTRTCRDNNPESERERNDERGQIIDNRRYRVPCPWPGMYSTGRERDTPCGVFSLPRRIPRMGRYWSGRRRNHQGVMQDAKACQCQCVTESPRKLDNAGKFEGRRSRARTSPKQRSKHMASEHKTTLFFLNGRHGGGELIGEGDERAWSWLEMVSKSTTPFSRARCKARRFEGVCQDNVLKVTRTQLLPHRGPKTTAVFRSVACHFLHLGWCRLQAATNHGMLGYTRLLILILGATA
jgi:hypothetical protein